MTTAVEAPPACAACEHTKTQHCPTDGCLSGVGTPQECVCAKYVAELHICEDCGYVFGEKWHLQIHRSGTPACLRQGRAAAGRHADPVKTTAPLAGMTAETVAAKRLKKRR